MLVEKTVNNEEFSLKRRNLAWRACQNAVALIMPNNVERLLTRQSLGSRGRGNKRLLKVSAAQSKSSFKLLKKKPSGGSIHPPPPCTSEG